MKLLVVGCLVAFSFSWRAIAATNVPASLTLPQCLDLALKQNPQVLKAKEDIRRTHGLIIEARAPALPQVTASGQYTRVDRDSVDRPPFFPSTPDNSLNPWQAKIEVTQLVYSGGRIGTALRAAKLSDQIAVLGFQRVVADTLLAVRRNFYQILLDQQLVTVREQSVALLQRQLDDTKLRFDAGAVPRFNVLRAEVELANARPPFIRAQNDLRLARESLVKLLAIDSPHTQGFTKITFDGKLLYEHRSCDLAQSLADALKQRPELTQADKQVSLAEEAINNAQAGNKPELSVFANYGIHDYSWANDMDETRQGWNLGTRVTWPFFDGFATRGRVTQARAQREQAVFDFADARRSIELEVRQACADHLQALELLEAQKKTVEQAEESLRLAEVRFRAGSGTQLDVFSAQTALTEARSNEIQALYAYNVALAVLDRVTGRTIKPAP
jgi:TolC family type I secretion outer membrane protein